MELMSKRTREGRPEQSDSNLGEPIPPLLSEKLIAELHGAVNAAQRKRMSHPVDKRENRSAARISEVGDDRTR